MYYNLGDFEMSVKFALAAGDKFSTDDKSEYAETIVSKCISHYIELSQQFHDTPVEERDSLPDEVRNINPQLVIIIERMLAKCYTAKEWKLTIGISLESRRLDVIENIMKGVAGNNEIGGEASALNLVNYVIQVSTTLLNAKTFRDKVLSALVPIVLSLKAPDYFVISKIIVQLNDYNLAVDLFKNLLNKDDNESKLVAYQVAFDLVASASQELLNKTSQGLGDSKTGPIFKINKILSGIPTCDYDLTFLFENNNTDLAILSKSKSLLDGRNSIFHSAITFENAFLHAGTADDNFFRSNLEWLGKATNWSKFSATAALGVIHKGNLSQGRALLEPYLPGSKGTHYTQGGSLYALGLIFAGHGKEVIEYLRQEVRNSESADSPEVEVISHGASLGVGVAAMATGNVAIYEELRAVLFTDSAIASSAAGLAMGLVMLGSSNEDYVEEMVQYAHDTAHETIIRSLVIGVALMMYGKEDSAEKLISRLLEEQDPILRYGGVFTVALAYCGTGNNKAIKRLLHIAVSDSNDDVRRVAVISLGFILLRNHTAVPRMVELLSQSHNPHVRYGSALALGISCAGKALSSAIELLEPLAKDPVDFVRQGALISMAMVLIQQNEKTFPKVTEIRKMFASVIQNKNQDALAKFGASVAQGIIDAGGRNVTISLEHHQTGNLNMKAIVGLTVFSQFWYWFPYTHFLSLSFTPTSIVGISEDLKIPKFDFNCHTKSALFDYPPKFSETVDKAPEKVATAVLSTTVKAKQRAKKSEKVKAEKAAKDENKQEKSIHIATDEPEDEKMDLEPTTPAADNDDE